MAGALSAECDRRSSGTLRRNFLRPACAGPYGSVTQWEAPTLTGTRCGASAEPECERKLQVEAAAGETAGRDHVTAIGFRPRAPVNLGRLTMAWFSRERSGAEGAGEGEKRVRTEGLWLKCEGCGQIIWKKA